MDQATTASDAQHPSKFHTFIQLAMFLAIITGMEIIIIFLPFSYATLFTTLAILSLVKFLAVIFWFMHLVYDRTLLTIVFFIGLLLGGGTLFALLALFMTDRSEASVEVLDTTVRAASITAVTRA